MFERGDTIRLLHNVRRAAYYVAYNMWHMWEGEEIKGCGKRASQVINLTPNYKKELGL